MAPLELPVFEEQLHGGEKRGWTGVLKRKILGAARRSRGAVEGLWCGCVGAEKKQSRRTRKVAVEQARRQRPGGVPALQRGDKPPDSGAKVAQDGPKRSVVKKRVRFADDVTVIEVTPVELSPGPEEEEEEEEAVAHDRRRRPKRSTVEKKVRFADDVTVIVIEETPVELSPGPEEEEEAVAQYGGRSPKRSTVADDVTVIEENATLVELLFPIGVLGERPSFRSPGPEEEEEENEDDEEEMLTPPTGSDDESDDEEEQELGLPRKTGMPFYGPGSEAAFVKAVVSRHLLKDDLTNRLAYQRSCDEWSMRQQSLVAAAGEDAAAVQERKLS